MQFHQNSKTSLQLLLTTMLAVIFLSGCGGGGSASPIAVPPAPSVPITSTNSDAVAAQAFAANDSLNSSRSSTGSLSNLLTGVSVSVDPNQDIKSTGLMSTVLGMVYTVQNTPISTNVLTGVATNYSFSCANGGTLQGSASKSAGYNINSGDAYTLTANNCVSGSDVVNGSVTISFSSIVGIPGSANAWSGTVSSTLNNFSVKSGRASAMGFSGDLSIRINQINAQTVGFELSGNSLISTNGSSSLSLTAFRFIGSQVGSTITYTTDFSLSGSSVTLGRFALTVQTTTPFKFTLGSNPSQGVLIVTGANKSALKLTVINSSSVKVDVDQDGDGIVDSTQARPWTALLSKQ